MIHLYNDDSFEVLKNIEKSSIDAIICDPPYGIFYKNKYEKEEYKWDNMSSEEYFLFTKKWLLTSQEILKKEGNIWFSYGFTMIEEVLKAIHETNLIHHYENCIVQARSRGRGSKHKLKSLREEWMHLTISKEKYTWNPVEYNRRVIVPYTKKNEITGEREKRGWDYGPDGKTPLRWSGMSNVCAFSSEPVWVDKKRGNLGNVLDLTSGLPLRFDGEPSDVSFFSEPSYLDTFQRQKHSAQKPIMMMVMLVLLSTKPGDTVIDPFMGAGTTGVACEITGRNFIGIEREKGTFQTAKNWIEGFDREKAKLFIDNHLRAKPLGIK